MKNRSALNFVVSCCLFVVHLLPGENETLLRGRDSFFLLDTLLDPLNLVGGLDVDLDLFPGQSLDLDQHLAHTTDTGMEYVTILGNVRRSTMRAIFTDQTVVNGFYPSNPSNLEKRWREKKR